VTSGWQCASCIEAFPNHTADREEALQFLHEQSRALIKAADSLDGSGLWAASEAVWKAAKRVEELRRAIAEEEPPTSEKEG
jgi:predicted translin family RNA/ssDNA-binding protein